MPLFHKLNLLTLNDVFKLEIAKFMHNIENNEHLPNYISKNFERVKWTHNYNTRHSDKVNYVLPKIRTETGKKSMVYCRGVQTAARESHRALRTFACGS